MWSRGTIGGVVVEFFNIAEGPQWSECLNGPAVKPWVSALRLLGVRVTHPQGATVALVGNNDRIGECSGCAKYGSGGKTGT